MRGAVVLAGADALCRNASSRACARLHGSASRRTQTWCTSPRTSCTASWWASSTGEWVCRVCVTWCVLRFAAIPCSSVPWQRRRWTRRWARRSVRRSSAFSDRPPQIAATCNLRARSVGSAPFSADTCPITPRTSKQHVHICTLTNYVQLMHWVLLDQLERLG